MSVLRKIGILGGMGPRATVLFEQILMDRLTGGDQDIPAVLSINDGSIPDRTAYLLGQGPDPIPAINNSMSILEEWGADIVCMPCNTACSSKIFTRINNNSKIISIPDTVAKHLDSGSVALVLATEGTVKEGIYDHYLSQHSIETVYPTRLAQDAVNEYIHAIKLGSDEALIHDLSEQIYQYINSLSGIDSVVLGCTELSGLTVDNKLNRIDSLEALAEEVVRRVGLKI